MKIDRNIPPNLEPPEFGKKPIGSTSLPTEGRLLDRLEPFGGGISHLFEAAFHREANVADTSFANRFFLGSQPISFGLRPDAPAPPAEEEAKSPLQYILGWGEDAIDWLGEHHPDVGDIKWLGEKAWEGLQYAGEGIADGLRAAKDGFDWLGKKVGDGMAVIENAISGAFDW